MQGTGREERAGRLPPVSVRYGRQVTGSDEQARFALATLSKAA